MNYKNYYIWDPTPTDKVAKHLLKWRPETVNFFCAEEYEKGFEWRSEKGFETIEEVSRHKTVNMIFGSFNCKFYKNNNNIPENANLFFWPTYWCTRSFIELQNNNCFGFFANDNPAVLFQSLNTQPHYHRCLMMDILASQDLVNKGAISWHIFPDDYNWQHWIPKKLILDKAYHKQLDAYKSMPETFRTSFMSLVTESTFEVPFITEKTWTNIFLGRPFLMYGHQYLHKHLKSLGFLEYDEIFDYSFEKQRNLEKRGILLVENIKRLQKENLKSLKEKIQEKLDYNQNLAFRIAKDINLIPEPYRNHLDLVDRGDRKADGPDKIVYEHYYM